MTKTILWITPLMALFIVCVSGAASRFDSSLEGEALSELRVRVKAELKLDDLVIADAAEPRASGIIKEEDEKQEYLVLLTRDICKPQGASGVVFVKPYVKKKLDEPADCGGRKIDRYRVEQGTGSETEQPPPIDVTISPAILPGPPPTSRNRGGH